MSKFSPQAIAPRPPLSPSNLSKPGSYKPPASEHLVPSAPSTASDRIWNIDESNAIRKLGFYLALVFVFVRFSLISEILDFGVGFKPYLVILLGPATLLLAVVSGGIGRCLRAKPAICYIGFLSWLILATPFSTWLGGTIHTLSPAFQTEFSMFLMIAGVTLTIREVLLMSYAIALGGALDIVASRFFGTTVGDRFGMAFGTLQNPNDYATHLLLTLAFVLLYVLNGKNRLFRIGAVGFVMTGLIVILKTGSRSAFLAIVILLGMIFLKARTAQRLVMIITAVAIAVLSLAILPGSVLKRYSSVFSSKSDYSAADTELEMEALGSKFARKELLQASILMTLQHPLFGVGPGQFAPSQADFAEHNGQSARWQVTHNTYTEISSEAGIPAFLLFLATLIGSMLLLTSVYNRSRKNADLRNIANIAFCMMLALTGLAVSITFASMEYRFYVPSMVGLIVAFSYAANREIQARTQAV